LLDIQHHSGHVFGLLSASLNAHPQATLKREWIRTGHIQILAHEQSVCLGVGNSNHLHLDAGSKIILLHTQPLHCISHLTSEALQIPLLLQLAPTLHTPGSVRTGSRFDQRVQLTCQRFHRFWHILLHLVMTMFFEGQRADHETTVDVELEIYCWWHHFFQFGDLHVDYLAHFDEFPLDEHFNRNVLVVFATARLHASAYVRATNRKVQFNTIGGLEPKIAFQHNAAISQSHALISRENVLVGSPVLG
jgi:hypothetical protein